MLDDRLSLAMAASQRSNIYGALMFLDLDNFKPLNDSLGHEAGDQLLIEVAQRLQDCVRKMDTVARVGGDEFVVLLSALSTGVVQAQSQASLIAEKIRLSLAQPYVMCLHDPANAAPSIEHHCTASIGVAMFRGTDATQDAVMARADHAMYQAKAAGRNRMQFAA